jgi:glycosyltransferase involved in cell wall biosynthesis
MACCTPVVAFNSTGLQDIIVHKETGYLATPFLPEDLAVGIDWILADEDRCIRLGEASRARTISSFDTAVAAQKMIQIYQEAIDAGKV